MSDINDIFQTELRSRRAKNIFAPAEKPTSAEGNVPKDHNFHISFDDTTEEALLNEEYGPQQVKSLLHLVLDPLDQKNIADAEDDVLAIHQLNQLNSHRGR